MLIDMFIALTMMMTSWVYTDVQTNQAVCINYPQFFLCQSYFSEVVFKMFHQYHQILYNIQDISGKIIKVIK